MKIGQSVNCLLYLEPLFRINRKFGFGISAGTGVSYLSEVYDELTNPGNKFFASHVAFMLMLDFKTKFRISQKFELTGSFCYNHISNGGIKQPNYGLYFYSPYKAKDPFYEKYLLQYKISNHLYSGVYMFAHGDAAESMGLNFGIEF